MGRTRQALRVAACTREAALYACEHWHYSAGMPAGKVACYGVWEEDQFIGAVVFSSGPGKVVEYARRYGVGAGEIAELARVALTDHVAPVTRIVAEAIKRLRADNPGLRLLLSYADPDQGHLGRIYQAGNWIYVGLSVAVPLYRINGEWRHNRTATGRGQWAKVNGREAEYLAWLRSLPRKAQPQKFRYLMPLDKPTRRRVMVDALPYPTYDDLAEQVSEARRRTSGAEGPVQSRGSAR